jgi:integrase
VIRVTERCYRGDFSTVKTRRSDRWVPLSPIVRSALLVWKERTNANSEDLVFATRNGKPLSDGNLLRRVIYPACDALQIPRLSWHLFRHLHGTLLAHLGVHVSIAQAQLGHADPRITLAIYTHVMPDAQREAVERLETFLMFPNVPKLPVSGAEVIAVGSE